MKYFKKYPIFFILVILLCAVFVGGTAYDVYLNMQKNDAEKKLNKAMSDYRTALSEDPTQVAIDASSANIQKLKDYLSTLEKSLTTAATDIFKPLSGKEGYQLVEQLRGMVNSWRRDAKNLGISVSDEMDFGFKKYVAPNAEPPKAEAVEAIWKQACVLDYINKKLFACKSEKSPMAIISVQREILPEEAVKEVKKRVSRFARAKKDDTKGDNFKIEDSITARKPGSLDTLAYRFIFTGHTDVLRRFLNQLKNFDAMLVVRSIGVKPADIVALETEMAISNASQDGGAFSALFGDGGDANAANAEGQQSQEQTQDGANGENAANGATVTAENRTPVVTDNISEFTVVIEYVEVVKDSPKQEKKDEADAEKTTNKK